MTESFRSPRIEGEFSGEQMRAWDVVWGAVRGKALIQNSYVDVTDVTITSGSSVIKTTGRYSLGFPRKDGGEEINARIEIAGRPVADLRHAFDIDEYDIDGLLSGEFTVTGKYLTPSGSGRMEIADAVFYGEPVDSASSSVLLEGKGVRLPNVQILKGGGRGTGNAYIGWDGSYAFSFNAQAIQAESITASKTIGMPLSALLNFTAAGSGTFESPKYEVNGTLNDVFVADEGIGQINGIINVSGELMTLQLEAASPRLSVSVVGGIAMTPEWDANVTVNVLDTSLDPYVRLFLPQTVAVHDRGGQRLGPDPRRAEEHRSSARRCDRRFARHAALRLRAAQRAADSPRPRSPRRSRHRHARRRSGHADRHRRHREPSRRDDQHARQRRRQPRGAPGICLRPPELGDGEPVGHARGVARRTRWSAARWR